MAAKRNSAHSPNDAGKVRRGVRVVSLFSGCGGLDLGFEAAGAETIAAVDNDFESCKTLRYNRPEWNVFEGDIRDYNPSMRDVDVVIGGPRTSEVLKPRQPLLAPFQNALCS